MGLFYCIDMFRSFLYVANSSRSHLGGQKRDVSMAASDATFKGCYSIRYQDPDTPGLDFAMDYNWILDRGVLKNKWVCSDTEVGTIHWMSRRVIPDHGRRAVYDHFGLAAEDIESERILAVKLSDLVYLRRKKEARDGLEPKVLKNMRMGCPSNEQYADMFEAA